MPKYRFRIRFIIPDDKCIECDKKTCVLDLSGGKTCVLESRTTNQPIKEARELILRSSVFNSEDEAVSNGIRAKNALRWSGTNLKLGINLGNDSASGGASNYYKQIIQKNLGIRLINDVHGLYVYDDTQTTNFIGMKGSLLLGVFLNKFVDSFTSAFKKNYPISEKKTLAFELYSLAQFEHSTQAKFLSLISAIEVLSERNERSTNSLKHVEMLINETKNSGLTQTEKDSLIGSLNWLRKDSITQAGKNLVAILKGQKYFQKSAKSFFQDCYTLRSELAHSGKVENETNLPLHELDRLVSNLLCTDASG